MGVDLNLVIPQTLVTVDNTYYCPTKIHLYRDEELFDKIRKLYTLPLHPLKVWCYEYYDSKTDQTTFGIVDEDAYGKQLTYIDALSLGKVLVSDDNKFNRGAGKLLLELDNYYPIILYWS